MEPNPTRGTGERDPECANFDECLSYADDNEWPAFNCEECEIALTGWSPEDEVSEGLVEAGLEGLRINPVSGKGFNDRDCAHFPQCNKQMLQREIGTWNCDFCDLCAKNVTEPSEAEEAAGSGKIELEAPGSDEFVITDRGPTPPVEFLQMFDEVRKASASANEKKGKKTKAASITPPRLLRTPQEPPKGPGQGDDKDDKHQEPPPGYPLVVRVDFAGRYELYRALHELAKDEVRTAEQQIIFILKNALMVDE